MNLPSPFAVSAEEQFMARELIMLMPQQFVRQDAMPGDQLVPLPLEALRVSLQQGRPALRLSQLYLACPSLFSRPVSAAEDVEIVLPFQKVKRMLDSQPGGGNAALISPFAAVMPSPSAPAARGDSPFGPPGSPFSQNDLSPQAAVASPFSVSRAAHESPFAMRAADRGEQAEVLSPASGASLPAVESPPPVNPFQRSETAPPVPPRAAQSPFQLVSPAPPASAEPLKDPLGFSASPPLPPFARAVAPEVGQTPPAVEKFPDTEISPAPPVVSGSEPLPARDASPFAMPGGALPPPATTPLASPPVRPHPVEEAPVLPPLIASPAAAAAASDQPQRLRVSLASLLRDVTGDDLGFDPSAVPGNVDAELLYDTVLPQLATGRVEVSIEELRTGVVERFRPAFARVKPGLRFVVPLSEIFRNLPSGAIPVPQPAEHVAISTTPFQTPFAIKADEDKTRAPLPSLSQMITPAAAEPAPLAPFPVAPPIESPKPQTGPVSLPPVPVSLPAPPAAEPVPSKIPGLPKLPSIPGMSGRPSPFARPPGLQPAPPAVVELPSLPPVGPPSVMPSLPASESHEDLGHPFSASELRAEPAVSGTAPLLPVIQPFDPAKLFAETPSPPPAAVNVPKSASAPAPFESSKTVPPVAKPAAPVLLSGPPVEFNFGEAADHNQTLLRAFFETSGDLTPHQVVDHCAQLQGLRSCLAIVSGKVIASGHDSGSDDVAHFTANAPRAVEYLTGLAGSMNCEGNGSITLRAGATVRTFFMESGICLAVLHEKPGFAHGVREKLILTARALADMMD